MGARLTTLRNSTRNRPRRPPRPEVRPRWRSSTRATMTESTRRSWEPTPKSCRRLTSSRTDAEDHAGALIFPKHPGYMADDACLDGAVMASRAVHGGRRRSGASMAAVAKHLICLRRRLGRSSRSPASGLQVVPAGPANLGPAMDHRPRPDSLADADATIVPPSKEPAQSPCHIRATTGGSSRAHAVTAGHVEMPSDLRKRTARLVSGRCVRPFPS